MSRVFLPESSVWHTRGMQATATVLAALVLGAPGLAVEQPASDEPQRSSAEPTGPDEKLTEVVVTAQKRKERLQEVPISAQVVTGEALTSQNTNSLETLSQIVPSVHVDATPGRTSNMFIRGIGSGANQSFDQSVGTFIDDIYHGRSRSSAATFLDLERVELLKGPQSTFFGNNAIAGALNMVTRKPGDSFAASARALYGQDGQYALEGEVGGPIGSQFGARLAVAGNGQDGWLRDVNLNRDMPQADNLAGRLTLAFAPTENFDATLKMEGSRNETDGLVYQITDCPRPAPFSPTASFGFIADCATALALGTPVGLDNNETAESAGQASRLDTTEIVLTANYERWGHVFTSVSGYYDYDYDLKLDTDILPPDIFNVGAPERYHQFSQEFRLTSASGGRFEYLAGMYYQTDGLAATQDFIFHFIGPIMNGLPLAQETRYAQDEDVYAVFGSLSWNATERLKLTAGLRGSKVEKDFDYALLYGLAADRYGDVQALPGELCTSTTSATDLQAYFGGPTVIGNPACAFAGSRSDKDWSPSARIEYKLSPAAMVYLRYDDAFKAGGFNGFDNTGNAANLPFGPEHVDAYEAGLKSEWLDNRLLVNLAVFRSDYRDLQVSVNRQDPTSGVFVTVVRNAAKSRSQGVELEAQWAATRGLRFAANVAWLDSHYITYQNTGSLSNLEQFCIANAADAYCLARYPDRSQFPAGIDPTGDVSGERTGFAPRWSGSLTASYSMRLSGDYRFTTEVIGFHTSDWVRDVLDEWTGAYTRLDGRLSLESPDGRWALDLIGKNLTDRIIFTAGAAINVAKQQPRNVAAQFRYYF